MTGIRKDAHCAPLPVRNGVAPSRVWLPQGPWPRLLDFLQERFVHLPAAALMQRLAQGDIVDQEGNPQTADSAYIPLRWLWYYREVANEAAVPFDLPVLYRDSCLVVVDKPHFLASIPGGQYLQETALIRLRRSLDLPMLSPIHRLDRDTAGVMLFCADPASRGAYQTLFQSRRVLKEYEAIAPVVQDMTFPLVYSSRLQQRAGQFTMHEVPGEPNSETVIEMIAAAALGHYRLRPITGRKHQLRLHMAALGMPICNDMFYPVLCQPPTAANDFSRPLQLLARAVEFTDPFSGQQRRFCSQRTLATAHLAV